MRRAAFAVVAVLALLAASRHAAGVEHVSPEPQRLPDWNLAAGGIRAFYFKDPDSHVLEVLWFPPGKGHAKWRRADALFLGIDHTAIVVADTERSLACYRDALGLAVAGTSENWGPEQERLNNVPGAHLRITTLHAPAGPGIELLEYLAPDDGRPAPADARANDLTGRRHSTRATPSVSATRYVAPHARWSAAPSSRRAIPRLAPSAHFWPATQIVTSSRWSSDDRPARRGRGGPDAALDQASPTHRDQRH